MSRQSTFVLIVTGFMLMPAVISAKVSGPCADCHTMHNSQNGADMMVAGSGPLQALLRNSCIGCHTGTNDGTFDGSISHAPYVFSSGAPTYGSTGTEGTTTNLAGGSFYWSSVDGDTGHNVVGINSSIVTAPGGSVDGPLSCAGSGGCHGDRSVSDEYLAIHGGHHNSDSDSYKDGSTVAGSYRYLLGVKGKEDASYEFRPVYNVNHNKYFGVDRTSESDSSGTISSFCANCHGDFHNGSNKIADTTHFSFGDGVWLRHPTDFNMARAATSSEYDGYNGGTGSNNLYSVIAPVATASETPTLNSTVNITTDDDSAIVMCISCHRAHGTPYAHLLRWDYKSWPGGGYNGCAICHSSKD